MSFPTRLWVAIACCGCSGAIEAGAADPGASGAERGSRDGGSDPGDPGAPGDGDDGAGGTRGGDNSGQGGEPVSGDPTSEPGVAAADSCLGAVFQSSAAPLRRLTADEYRNTVAALFPGASLPRVELVADTRQDGFTTSAAGQSASSLAVEHYQAAAEAVAAAAFAVRSTWDWAPCLEPTLSCAQEVARELAFRAYRRPLTAPEGDALDAFVRDAHPVYGDDDTQRMLIEALLQSPYFLYRPEFGSGSAVGDGAVALTDYEMASRLSYFFVASMPDDELFAAAAAGELMGEEGIRAQAQRLIGDPRARAVLDEFFVQWLGLYRLEGLALDAAVFPQFDDRLRDDLAESARRYVDRALWELDSWRALMTGSFGYVNDRLAPIFGVPAPGGEELVRVELDPSERMGVLTQPGVLASTSHGIRHSPILRGVTLLDRVLCMPPPAPPPGAATAEPLPVDPSEICTTRDEVHRTHTEGNGCQGCHASIDGAGFTFEHYDALGSYRDEENGCAIDATGSLSASDIEGAVDGAVELASRLVDSETVTACATEHLFAFALGRLARGRDDCEIRALAERLRSDDDSLQGLLLDLVASPSFRSRPEAP